MMKKKIETSKTHDFRQINFEAITTVQQAINMAVGENRVVRFLSDKSNQELKSEIVDLKGCKLVKPERNSIDVAVVPPSIKDFDFHKVDTSLVVSSIPLI